MNTRRPVIAIVSPYRIEYGPLQVLGHVARAISEAGMTPLCIVPAGGVRSLDLSRLGAEVQTVEGLGTVPRTLNPSRLGTFLRRHVDVSRQIEEIASAAGADAIYATSEATFAGGLAARRLGVPSIVHVIGMSIQSPRAGAHAYVRLLDHLTDQFIACSSAVAEMLLRFGTADEKITVVHNGIPVVDILATEGIPSPITGAHPRIGMLAAYDPRKGHELFVNSAAIIAKRFPDARFFLIGGVLGTQRESVVFERHVETLISQLGLEDRFERTGYIPAPEIYSWIRALDVMIVPSKTEAFAHALPEAMVCKVPVVATAIEGNLDAFVDGHSGLYAESTAASVAGCVEVLLEDPARSAAIAEAAHKRARLLFDLEVTLRGLGAAVSRTIKPGHATKASDAVA